MPNLSYLPLQKSIYQALTADAPLTAMITGVFDNVPQSTDFPYVTIGESIVNDWSTKTSSGFEQFISIRVWSREGGRKEAVSVMEKIYSLLHGASLTVEGLKLVLIRQLSSNVTLENDGWTYQGIMRFRALLESY